MHALRAIHSNQALRGTSLDGRPPLHVLPVQAHVAGATASVPAPQGTVVMVGADRGRLDALSRHLGDAGVTVRALVTGALDRATAVELEPWDLLLVVDPAAWHAPLIDDLRARCPETPIIAAYTAGVSPATSSLAAHLLDDFVHEPMIRHELPLRWKLAWRRRAGRPLESDDALQPTLTIDAVRHVVAWRDRRVVLSRREFQLLECLHRSSPFAVPRARIVREVWAGAEVSPAEGRNVLEVYVSYVRRKLQRISCSHMLRTVRGVGYSLALTDTV